MHDQTALYYAESVLKMMLRAGLVGEDDVLAMADEHALLAERNPHEAEVRQDTAHQLRCTLMAVDPPPAVDPRSEHRASALRREMVERTKMIERGE